MKRLGMFLVLVGVLIGFGWSAAISYGETPEEFYRGKTISILTGTVGGNADAVSRVLVPFMEKETGAAVIIKNQPGGGTIQTNNMAYRAKPDGLTLLLMEPSAIALSTWFKEAGAVFDVAKFNWLAQVGFEPSLFVASPQKPYQTIKDLQQAKGMKFSTSSPLSWFGLVNMMLCDILKLDAKVVSGFKGAGPMVLSMQKGEIDGGVVSESLATRQARQLRPLFIFHTECKLFPNLPYLRKMVNLTKEQEMLQDMLAPTSKGIATSPGVGQDKIDYLRKVFNKISEDKNAQKSLVEMGGFGAWYGYVRGEEFQKQVSHPQVGQDVKRLVDNLLEKYMER
jgi:tripartite-type tricarboxylate transporter receptor subunit TctC